ncbi:MAG: N-acetylneuraminate synthase family protein [Flavobacteriales bacterium]|jgi:sialic acid synthase
MKSTYLIGEIGQNHNGSVDIAKLIIDLVARDITLPEWGVTYPGMNAVKLTKRDLQTELSASQMSKPYNSPHSFGDTYGAHREFLELNDEEHYEVYQHAKSNRLEFVETLCAIGCLSIFRYFTPDRLKVASRDLTNLPLLNALAETQVPIIVSTGMAGKRELDMALDTITKHHDKVSILHCVSEYPTQPKNVNLLTIKFLKENYPDYTIGYSDHTVGISTPLAAVAMGAEIIEKHITIDRRMKGTDQAGSLGPDGVYRMVRDIRILNESLGVEDIFICEDVNAARTKLERSIASKAFLPAGHVIQESDLQLLSPGDGVKWADRSSVIGKAVRESIAANEIIYPHHLAQ